METAALRLGQMTMSVAVTLVPVAGVVLHVSVNAPLSNVQAVLLVLLLFENVVENCVVYVLHVDLPQRIHALGYPLTTVAATH